MKRREQRVEIEVAGSTMERLIVEALTNIIDNLIIMVLDMWELNRHDKKTNPT